MAELTVSVGFRDDDYILLPACVYCGNRFPVLQKKYPPIFTPDDAQTDLPITITEVPRLHPDGSGTILPPGFINERVNMSDWEGSQNVGEVFCGSCWSEVSNMLHLADLWDEDAPAK